MAKKYYAIAKGKSGIPKIVETWTECQKEVIGCKISLGTTLGQAGDP